MITSITKNIVTALLRNSIRFAWCLISISEQRLNTRWNLLARLCKRTRQLGEALEGQAERIAERLGIDILDVLAPIVAPHLR